MDATQTYDILESKLITVPYFGEKTSNSLERMSIFTVRDMLYHFPIRYLDVSSLKKISDLRINENATVIGTVIKTEKKNLARNRSFVRSIINDGSSYLTAVWFNQLYLGEVLTPGSKVALSGKVSFKYNNLQMESPFYEQIGDTENTESDLIHTNRIIPIHKSTAGLTTRNLRRLTKICLEFVKGKLADPLERMFENRFMPLEEAFGQVHFPSNFEKAKLARFRFKWEELFYMQTALALKKDEVSSKFGFAHISAGALRGKILESLPFELTASQKKVLTEIDVDMSSIKPMHRLIQGDVGSGKTVIAVLAMLNAIENGYQAALMAPTEILAEQHYDRYSKLLDNLDVKIALLKGGLPEKEKKLILEKIESGKINAVFGTHALIQKDVRFKQLSIVIVDEQHRFGVEQRAAFKSKGSEPDMLAMTATPIPRTMALTFYGDLDLSVLDEKPAGRKDVSTVVYSKDEIAEVQNEVLQTINKNRQVYVVCPLIEESEKLDITSLEEEVGRWTGSVLKDCSVGVIHGKLNSINKNEIMKRFASGDIKVLFCTTLIEVGMDIQNACMIVILNAERYGLSQLHQMRGRVGRGSAESKCVLVADISQEKTGERLEALVNNFDGFRLAEIDLILRKEGQIFGQKQWGRSDLKLASLPKDLELLKQARDEAFKLVETSPKLKKYPQLAKEIDRLYLGSISWINKS